MGEKKSTLGVTVGSLQRQFSAGFTLVEIMIVIAVAAILAAIVVVGYNGVQHRSASTAAMETLHSAQQVTGSTELLMHTPPTSLPSDVQSTSDVMLTFTKGGNHYSGLSAVQNGVLFYTICKQLITDPKYSVIHSKDGTQTSSVVMSCDDGVAAGSMLITAWDSKRWYTPVTEATIQSYVNSVPYDNWWTDRQSVVRGFYTTLMTQFISSGGTWPITSFWDTWANQWAGVPKEDLPAPDSTSGENYCIMATHTRYSDIVYHVNGADGPVTPGAC